MNIKIHFLKVQSGDCFIIMFYDNTETHMLLIDGGFAIHYPNIIEPKLKETLKKENSSNNILLTHIDRDHIGGLIRLFKSDLENKKFITNVFYNTTEYLKHIAPNVSGQIPENLINTNLKTSYNQGKKLEELLEEQDIPLITGIVAGDIIQISKNIIIKILSPRQESLNKYKEWIKKEENKLHTSAKKSDYENSLEELKNNIFEEDNDAVNASSIGILIEASDKKMLFLGDSYSSDIIKSLNDLGYTKENKLEVDIVKVSHHGSKYNTSNELLECIRCNKFIISANGKTNYHPNKETLARIIYSQNKPQFIFNYDLENKIFTNKEKENQLFSCKMEELIEI